MPHLVLPPCYPRDRLRGSERPQARRTMATPATGARGASQRGAPTARMGSRRVRRGSLSGRRALEGRPSAPASGLSQAFLPCRRVRARADFERDHLRAGQGPEDLRGALRRAYTGHDRPDECPPRDRLPRGIADRSCACDAPLRRQPSKPLQPAALQASTGSNGARSRLRARCSPARNRREPNHRRASRLRGCVRAARPRAPWSSFTPRRATRSTNAR